MASSAASRACTRLIRHEVYRTNLQTSSQLRSVPRWMTTVPANQSSLRLQRSTRTYATSPSSQSTTSTTTDPAQPTAPTDEAQTPKARRDQKFKEAYIAQAATEHLFKECARQADYIVPQAFEKDGDVPKNAAGEDVGEGTGWWYDRLVPTFNTWAQVTFLHLYLLNVRFRYFPPEKSALWMQHLTDHLFFEAEHRMTLFHNISSRAIRNRYLKDLYNQWRGVIGAYDEGLIKGDAVLATAIWRNLFKGDENADWTRIAQITSYLRRALKGLDGVSDEVVEHNKVRFAGPENEQAVVLQEASGMTEPFEKIDEDEFEEWKKSSAARKLEQKKK